jgi:hypothetical protein
MILANKIFFVLVIVSGLATLGVLFAGLVSMARGPTNSLERARGSNKLMWWRVRLQLLTLAFILLWWMTKG